MKMSTAVQGYILEISSSYALSTVQMYGVLLKKFIEYTHDCEIESIKPQDLTAYMTYLRTDYKPSRFKTTKRTGPLAGSSLDNYWKVIRSFFRWCDETLKLPRPDLRLKRPKFKIPEVLPFSVEEIRRLMEVCEWTKEIAIDGKRAYRRKKHNWERDRALVLLFLDTGLRLGEIDRLTVEDINLETGEIMVAPFGSGQKTKPRIVYLGKAARRAMWVWCAKRMDTPKLFGFDGKRTRELIHRLGYLAQIPDCHPHRFRHTFAIEFLRNGG